MPSPDLKRIAFLLGAGASLEAGMPSTEEITKRVLSGEVIKCDNEPQILKLLKWLEKNKIDNYYSRCGSTNYENLYYVVSQVQDAIDWNYDNPALQPLINEIISNPELLHSRKGNEPEEVLLGLSRNTTEYIEGAVCQLIYERLCCLRSLDYLAIIKDAYLDTRISIKGVFTLNHDPVLERFFESNGIQFNDGFMEFRPYVHVWIPELLRQDCSKLRLFKLHGSWNWFRDPCDDLGSDLIVTFRSENAMEKAMSQSRWSHLNERMILIGTFNKELAYTRRMFADLFCQFWQSLKKIDRLIVSGYSFGDSGINSQVIAWILSSPDNRMVVIDLKDEDKYRMKARGAIRRIWEELKEKDKLFYMKNKFNKKEVSWEEIKSKLR